MSVNFNCFNFVAMMSGLAPIFLFLFINIFIYLRLYPLSPFIYLLLLQIVWFIETWSWRGGAERLYFLLFTFLLSFFNYLFFFFSGLIFTSFLNFIVSHSARSLRSLFTTFERKETECHLLLISIPRWKSKALRFFCSCYCFLVFYVLLWYCWLFFFSSFATLLFVFVIWQMTR